MISHLFLHFMSAAAAAAAAMAAASLPPPLPLSADAAFAFHTPRFSRRAFAEYAPAFSRCCRCRRLRARMFRHCHIAAASPRFFTANSQRSAYADVFAMLIFRLRR